MGRITNIGTKVDANIIDQYKINNTALTKNNQGLRTKNTILGIALILETIFIIFNH